MSRLRLLLNGSGDPDKRNRDERRREETERRPNGGKCRVQISKEASTKREKKGERVRKDQNSRKRARGKVRKRAGKRHPQSSGFRYIAGADVPGGLREGKRSIAKGAGTDDSRAPTPKKPETEPSV